MILVKKTNDFFFRLTLAESTKISHLIQIYLFIFRIVGIDVDMHKMHKFLDDCQFHNPSAPFRLECHPHCHIYYFIFFLILFFFSSAFRLLNQNRIHSVSSKVEFGVRLPRVARLPAFIEKSSSFSIFQPNDALLCRFDVSLSNTHVTLSVHLILASNCKMKTLVEITSSGIRKRAHIACTFDSIKRF